MIILMFVSIIVALGAFSAAQSIFKSRNEFPEWDWYITNLIATGVELAISVAAFGLAILCGSGVI